MKRIIALSTVLVLIILSVMSVSAQTIAVDLPCDLNLKYKDDNAQPIADLSVSVYRVAALDEDGKIEHLPGFADYESVIDAADRIRAAAELENLMIRDGVKPDHSVRTDSSGEIALSGLETGVYLITSETLTQGDTLLSTQPLLLDLPMIDERSGVYAYEVTASPKPSRQTILKELNVVVLWKDAGSEGNRPSKVTVDLYCDGKLFDTQSVTAANGWKYTWNEITDSKLRLNESAPAGGGWSDATAEPKNSMINGEHNWYVVEHGADGYTVTYAVRPVNNTFVVINTKTIATPDQPTPQLPQTGQLWWPIPLLAGAGILMFLIGLRKKGNRHE